MKALFLFFLLSFKSPVCGKENVWFLDSPDFENFLDVMSGRALGQAADILKETMIACQRCKQIIST